ncbi:MAG: DUF4287 domain-containing protein [Chloroflexi bacterium HGW-Chloroflexi-3]|nr:MAG: DUF4287 domain-containing protein [Chloroflexi bacterium HGW-Chloroflexi-3]
MNSIDKAFETQLSNIQKRTDKTLDELFELIKNSGFEKHGEIRDFLKNEFHLGFGDANTLAQVYKKAQEPPAESSGAITNKVDEIYSGSRESLRPLHDAVMNAFAQLGDFEISPKKTYLSLRRKKQFAMVGPGTKGRLEIEINMKDIPATERLVEQPPGGMCQYKVWLTDEPEVNEELLGWIKTAYDSAG